MGIACLAALSEFAGCQNGSTGSSDSAFDPAAYRASHTTDDDAGPQSGSDDAGTNAEADASTERQSGGNAGAETSSPPGTATSATNTPPQVEPDDVSVRDFKLVVIGSSTAAGTGASSQARSWVEQLSQSLRRSVEGTITTENLAVPGYSNHDLAQGSAKPGNIDEALRLKPDLLIIALAGGNDLALGSSQEEYISRIERLRTQANAADSPVFVMGTAPKDVDDAQRRQLKAWSSAMLTTFNECWVPGQTSAHSPCFIPIFDVLADANLGIAAKYSAGDGTHVNDAGHARILERTLPIVQPYVCSVTRCQ